MILPVYSFEPALLRKVSELTEYVVVDDEEYEVVVWEISLRMGEDLVLYSRRYVRDSDMEQEYRIRYSMIYNETSANETDAVENFNRWVYQILLHKVFK